MGSTITLNQELSVAGKVAHSTLSFREKLASNSQAAHFWYGKKAGHGCTRHKFFKHGAKSSRANHPLFP